MKKTVMFGSDRDEATKPASSVFSVACDEENKAIKLEITSRVAPPPRGSQVAYLAQQKQRLAHFEHMPSPLSTLEAQLFEEYLLERHPLEEFLLEERLFQERLRSPLSSLEAHLCSPLSSLEAHLLAPLEEHMLFFPHVL